MSMGWRGNSILVVALMTLGCGDRVGKVVAVASAPGVEKNSVAAVDDPLKGYPDAPGSKEALDKVIRAQDRETPDKRLGTVLRYAKEPAGAKLLEAELARRKSAPPEVLSLIASVRAKAPGTPVAASAFAVELDALRQQDPTRFVSRCQEILDSPSSSDGDKAVALYTRAVHYRDTGQAKLGAIDALRFWAGYPAKVRRMKAEAVLAAQVRNAGFLCEADMLEDSDEPENVAQALYEQFSPLRDVLAGAKEPEANESYLTVYAMHAPNTEAIAAKAPGGEAPSWEKAQFLGRVRRLVAYEGDLDRAVALSQDYMDSLKACLDGNALPDDALVLAYAQTRASAECLRRMLADPHFVRGATANSSGAAASMRSEQVLGNLSVLSLDLAERRCEKGRIDEARLAQAYVRHAETLKTINDTGNTIKACRRFVENHPKAAEAPGFLKRIAEAYLALDALGSAADTFKELYERYPDCAEAPAAHANRVTCLYQSEAYEQAYEEGTALCAARPDDPNTANILLLRGLSEGAMGMEEQAGESMRELVTRFPSSAVAPQALLWLASQALSAQEYGEAKKCFQDLVDRYPNSDAAQRAREYLERLGKMTAESRNAN